MHGSSGVPDAAIRQAVELGVSKINIDTDIRQAFVRSAVAYMKENPDNIDPRKILAPAKESAKNYQGKNAPFWQFRQSLIKILNVERKDDANLS